VISLQQFIPSNDSNNFLSDKNCVFIQKHEYICHTAATLTTMHTQSSRVHYQLSHCHRSL